MIRPSTLFWFCSVIAVGFAMFQVKYEVMHQEQTLAKLDKEIAGDRAQLRVLRAEWSYLTRPDRLERLAGEFLHLSSMNAARIVTLDEVPLRSNGPALVSPAAERTPAPLSATAPNHAATSPRTSASRSKEP